MGASRELKEAFATIDMKKVGEEMLHRSVDWIYNVPLASHFGGVWERQIRTIRNILTSILNEQTLTDDSLETLFCEIEQIINARPITTVSSDVDDLLPLTPNQLLTLKASHVSVPQEYKEFTRLQVKWKQVQYLADLFWKRWVQDYLSTLQVRQKWIKQKRNLMVGDIVLVTDLSKPRNKWPLAVVKDVKYSHDNLVRSATVKCEGTLLKRPISKLVLLLENETN